jgi:carboxypeptidase family protein
MRDIGGIKMRRFLWRGLLAAALVFSFVGSAHAQGMGSIFGKVTDGSGAPVPGVTVTVSGTGLQVPRTVVTAESGAYQVPNLPIGTYQVTFELQGFKKVTRPDILITAGFNAPVDTALEVGAVSEVLTVSGITPVVDTKRTTVGGTFDLDTLQNIPTARDPWMIIYMAPGIQLGGTNVGGSSSGSQPSISSRGTTANVQWNMEGGATTDLQSNSSASYYNFDALEQLQVINGGGDVSVQSSGVSINLITKSGSNIFKGSATGTLTNDAMQFQNVDAELFSRGTGGFLSGAPLNRVTNVTGEYGGPIIRNKLWFWGNADHQDINAAVLNYYDASKGGNCAAFADAQRLGTLNQQITFANLNEVRDCLHNDKTVIYHVGGKLNYTLNNSHKFQYLIQGDDKIQDSRGASATTAKEATNRQYSDYWHGIPQPTHSLTHTYVATDKLVFNSIYTYVYGGWSNDFQDFDACGETRYNGADNNDAYARPENCLWNQQQLSLRTTGFQNRSLLNSVQRLRPSHELKTDATYFVSNKLGGDHSLKFGVGYRRNPSTTFSHYAGGARAWLQCNGNSTANCVDNRIDPGTAGPGMVPYRAVLYRDQLRNSAWWGWSGYVQESYNRGRYHLNGGVRYDWQHSKYNGGCVPANVIRPDLLPAQCEAATQEGINPNTGQLEKIRPFSYFSPRVSLTYDLRGDGKTALKGAWSYYFETYENVANNLGGLFTVTTLTFGSNANNGTCTGTSCWTDANKDGIVQGNELTGVPTSGSTRFNTTTGVLSPAGNAIDPDAKLGRTREGVVGVQHELRRNLAVGVDYIYRKYDRGLTNYTLGYQPGAPGYPLSNIYEGPLTYTDPTSGNTGEYYVVRQGAMRPSATGTITVTNPNSQVYHGVDMTLTKRYSDRWQLAGGLTIQDSPLHFPVGSSDYSNPTGRIYRDGVSILSKYVLKLNGSYELPWGIVAAGNLNMFQGASRTLTMDGPGNVYGGVNAAGNPTTISYTTLEFQDRNATRIEDTKLLDLGVQKVFRVGPGGKYQVRVIADLFNVFNVNTVLTYASGNVSSANSTAPSSIIPPRVLRLGVRMLF